MKFTKLNKLDLVATNGNKGFRKLSSNFVTLVLLPWGSTPNLDEVNVTCTINGVQYSFPYVGGNPIKFILPYGTNIKLDMYYSGCPCGDENYKGYAQFYYNDSLTAFNPAFKFTQIDDKNQTLDFLVLKNISIKPKVLEGTHSGCDLSVGGGILPRYSYHNARLDFNDIDVFDTDDIPQEDIDITSKFVYVSLGDSIAAGHSLRYYNSGTDKQIGAPHEYVSGKPRTYTEIEDGCYTDLIAKELLTTRDDVFIRSFAKSGDRVNELIDKLANENVVYFLENANIVTVCIGANNILVPAMEQFGDYVVNGKQTLENLANDIDNEIIPAFETSLVTLFETLNNINPNAKYIFTTIYNPYKYLHLDEGENGFFKGLINLAPTIASVSSDIANFVENDLLDTDEVKMLFDRTNAISAWTETQIKKLNTVLSNKIASYSNFYLADTKASFDECTSGEEYADLVNVEFYSGLEITEVNWGQLYGSMAPVAYWASMFVSNPTEEKFIKALLNDVINKVILPDIDPHPKKGGHKVLSNAFWECFKTTL